jgi:nucleotide-binding universal stress UspA family protein
VFRHILIPTDGSERSQRAVEAGLRLARETGAQVTAYHAADPAPHLHYADGFAAGAAVLRELAERQREAALRHLEPFERAAREAGVKFRTVIDTAGNPDEGIVEAARKGECDLIVMASHGRSGMASVLLGSVTQKVLAHAKIPVMVTR